MALAVKTVRWAFETTTDPGDFDFFFTASGGGVTFVDETTDAGDSGTADVSLVGAAANDALYFGMSALRFCGYFVDMQTNAAGGTRLTEYWNGAWTSLTHTLLTGADLLNADTVGYFDVPSDWTTTTINGQSAYWIRKRTGTVQTTQGVANIITPAPYIEWSALSITIPENSVTVKNAFLRVDLQTPILGQIDLMRVECRTSTSNAFARVYGENTAALVAAGAESMGLVSWIDCTSVFASANLQTMHFAPRVALLQRGVNANVNNNNRKWAAELFITYTFDDTSPTQLNTVVIPIDSNVSARTATTGLSVVGQTTSANFPNLSTFCPEASIVNRQLYVRFEANTGEGAATDWNFDMQLDANVTASLGKFEGENQSDYYWSAIWVPTTVTLGEAHTLKAAPTSVARMASLNAQIVYTYSYDYSATTSCIKSIQHPIFAHAGYVAGATGSADKKLSYDFHVEDLSASLVQSGVQLFLHGTADAGNIQIQVGQQASARNIELVGSNIAGPIPAMVRFDAGAANGVGHTLVQGRNTLNLRYFANLTTANAGGVSGLLYLNYKYQKPVSGKRTTTYWHLIESGTLSATNEAAVTVSLPPLGSVYSMQQPAFLCWDTVAVNNYSIGIKSRGSVSTGWIESYFGPIPNDAIMGSRFCALLPDAPGYKLNDVDNVPDRQDIFVSTIFRVQGLASRPNIVASLWGHSYSYLVSGIVSGGGDSQQTVVEVFDASTGLEMYAVTIASALNCPFVVTAHSQYIPYFVAVSTSSSLVGRSVTGFAE